MVDDSLATGAEIHGMGEKEGEAKPGDGGESAGALVAHSLDRRRTAHARRWGGASNGRGGARGRERGEREEGRGRGRGRATAPRARSP